MRAFPSIRLSLGGILAGLGAIGTFLSAIYIFVAPDDPEPMAAHLSNVTLAERQASYGQDRAANRISYTFEFTGFEGQTAYATYAVYDAFTLQRLPFEDWRGTSMPVAVINVEASPDRAESSFLVPYNHPESRCVFVRVSLFDTRTPVPEIDNALGPSAQSIDPTTYEARLQDVEQNTLLASADSESFDTHAPGNGACVDREQRE